MLITRFHMLIRHRVVWGVIAVIVSLTFLLSFTRTPGCNGKSASGRDRNAVGELFGESVSATELRMAIFFELGLSSDSGLSPEQYQRLRKQAWRRLAILHTARTMGIETPDAEIAQILGQEKGFQTNGAFDKTLYVNFVRSRNVDIPTFETYLRQNLTIQKVLRVLESMVWTAPSELDERLRNLTDRREVEYVALEPNQYTGTVSVTAEDVRAYYDSHRDHFAIPERVRVRYVSFPYSNVATVTVTEAEIQAYYDLHPEEFKTESTNQYALPEPFESVSNSIAERLKTEAIRFETRDTATRFVMDLAPDQSGGHTEFDDLARARGLNVSTTGFFSADSILSSLGVGTEFTRAAFGLMAGDADLSFSDAVSGSNAVYVLAADDRREARIPEFEEVTNAATPMAKAQAKHEAFAEWAHSLQAQLADAVASTTRFDKAVDALGFNVITTGTFTIMQCLNTNMFPRSDALVSAIVELNRGEVGKAVSTADGEALIPYMKLRQPGDLSASMGLRPQLQRTLEEYAGKIQYESWGDYLLQSGGLKDFQQASEDAAAAEEATNAPPVDG